VWEGLGWLGAPMSLCISHMDPRFALQEESSRAAVLLEQSAHCLLCMSPPAVRKCAFHMVMAGLRYSGAGLKRLGINAYRCTSAGHSRLAQGLAMPQLLVLASLVGWC
jgi:hypothetical protein